MPIWKLRVIDLTSIRRTNVILIKDSAKVAECFFSPLDVHIPVDARLSRFSIWKSEPLKSVDPASSLETTASFGRNIRVLHGLKKSFRGRAKRSILAS